MSSEPIVAVDLFCGAGGLSTGLALACEDLDRDVDLVVVNHWNKAIETHKKNHPDARHLNAKVEQLHPPDVVDAGSVDILVAAPECTHFSTARGGKPVSEQQRSSPMHVLDWVGKLRPRAVLVENVPEFESWGPIVDGKPTRDGTKFDAWISQFEADRYSVEFGTLNAADYGDPTSRRRFFIMARRDYEPDWPAPSHSEDGETAGTKEWRTASEIIDLSEPGQSIWERSRPLSVNTMKRIAMGLRRYGPDELEPYANAVGRIGRQSDDDAEYALDELQEDVVKLTNVDQAVEEREAPFLVKGQSITVTPDGAPEDSDIAPYYLPQGGGGVPKRSDEVPLSTIATDGAIATIDPTTLVLPRNGTFRGLDSNPAYGPGDRPLHTVTASNHDGHCVDYAPSVLKPKYGRRDDQTSRNHDLDRPLMTVPTSTAPVDVAQPYLVEYYGNSDAASIDEPLPTVTCKDRHALCVPDLYPWGLDIRYRMLKPAELKAAQGFPDDYEICGNKGEQTRQIGNAVPVNLAKALCKKLLTPSSQPTVSRFGENAERAPCEGGDD